LIQNDSRQQSRSTLNTVVRRLRHLGTSHLPIPADLRSTLRSAIARSIPFEVAPPTALQPGLAFIGYPRAEFGLGEALRLLAEAASCAALPFAAFDIDDGIWARQDDKRLAHDITPVLDRRVNLLIQSALQAGHTSRLLGPAAFTGRRNILYAFWELPELPARLAPDLAAYDEIWVPSQFVAAAFGASFDGPVFLLPPPIRIGPVRQRPRSAFGLPDDRFLFHYAFDFSSHGERKNPRALLAAFRRCAGALPPGRVGLVLKTMGGGADSRKFARLIAGQPDVFLIDRVLDHADVLALQATCDCFVSLHRSEGFGLGIAEAMALGKPVIATNFGGAVDLLAPDRACPVGYRLVPVTDRQYPDGRGQYWAEADVEEAAVLMRKLAESPEWARQIGFAGQRFAAKVLAPERIGALMSEHLAATTGLHLQ
jgi:glycosyltransferase involved in cell wall biosynthesis